MTASETPRTAVLGAGVIGSGMARSLHREGFDVVVWNRSADKLDLLADEGVPVEADLGKALEGRDVVVAALFDLDATLEVLRAALPRLSGRTVVVQSGTVGAPGAREVASLLEDAGVASLDAPVLGTKQPADEGKLTVLAAGPRSALSAVEPVLAAVGAKTLHVGEQPGVASALKLACNSWVATVTVGTAQALSLAVDGGVDPELFLEAISGSAVDAPYVHVKGKAMLERSYPTSFAVDGVVKDVDLMLAQATDTDTGVLEAAREVLAATSAQGHGRDDMAAVYEGVRRS